MAISSLTLLLSGLSAPENGHWPRLPALQLLLSKGERQSTGGDIDSILFTCFDIPPGAGGEFPLAAVSALGDGLACGDGWWLRADPVHFVADRDQLFLSASHALDIGESEAQQLLDALNQLYAPDGWQFVAAGPQRWYLRLPGALAIQTIPTAAAMGRRVGEVLPRGEDALSWQRAMTEMQMLLHASPLNTQREARGLPTINGIWFWGGGALPKAAAATPWGLVVSDGPVAKGLAQRHHVATSSPHDTDLDSLWQAGGEILWQATETSLAQAEVRLFGPLLAALRTGKLGRLELIIPSVGQWCIDDRALRRWWRRRKPLSSLLRGGA